MTAHERIEAAIAARDKATPGPLKVVFKGTIDKYTVEKQEGGVHKQLAYCGYSDARLIAAAPDLVDEVIRLRKWQSEATEWLQIDKKRIENEENCKVLQPYIDWLDRLIAEAQEDYVDGHKQC